jgi:hypothetical protein
MARRYASLAAIVGVITVTLGVACDGSRDAATAMELSVSEVERAFEEAGLPLVDTGLYNERDERVKAALANYAPDDAGKPIYVVVFSTAEDAASAASPVASPSDEADAAIAERNIVVFFGHDDTANRLRARERAIASLGS